MEMKLTRKHEEMIVDLRQRLQKTEDEQRTTKVYESDIIRTTHIANTTTAKIGRC
jgi:hypothetical protein